MLTLYQNTFFRVTMHFLLRREGGGVVSLSRFVLEGWALKTKG